MACPSKMSVYGSIVCLMAVTLTVADQAVIQGHNATVICPGMLLPDGTDGDYTVYWFKTDGQTPSFQNMITSYQPADNTTDMAEAYRTRNFSLSPSGDALFIPEVQLEDEGGYTCWNAGTDSGYVGWNVTVLVYPSGLSIDTGPMSAGEDATISCIVDHIRPLPRDFRWLLGNETLQGELNASLSDVQHVVYRLTNSLNFKADASWNRKLLTCELVMESGVVLHESTTVLILTVNNEGVSPATIAAMATVINIVLIGGCVIGIILCKRKHNKVRQNHSGEHRPSLPFVVTTTDNDFYDPGSAVYQPPEVQHSNTPTVHEEARYDSAAVDQIDPYDVIDLEDDPRHQMDTATVSGSDDFQYHNPGFQLDGHSQYINASRTPDHDLNEDYGLLPFTSSTMARNEIAGDFQDQGVETEYANQNNEPELICNNLRVCYENTTDDHRQNTIYDREGGFDVAYQNSRREYGDVTQKTNGEQYKESREPILGENMHHEVSYASNNNGNPERAVKQTDLVNINAEPSRDCDSPPTYYGSSDEEQSCTANHNGTGKIYTNNDLEIDSPPSYYGSSSDEEAERGNAANFDLSGNLPNSFSGGENTASLGGCDDSNQNICQPTGNHSYYSVINDEIYDIRSTSGQSNPGEQPGDSQNTDNENPYYSDIWESTGNVKDGYLVPAGNPTTGTDDTYGVYDAVQDIIPEKKMLYGLECEDHHYYNDLITGSGNCDMSSDPAKFPPEGCADICNRPDGRGSVGNGLDSNGGYSEIKQSRTDTNPYSEIQDSHVSVTERAETETVPSRYRVGTDSVPARPGISPENVIGTDGQHDVSSTHSDISGLNESPDSATAPCTDSHYYSQPFGDYPGSEYGANNHYSDIREYHLKMDGDESRTYDNVSDKESGRSSDDIRRIPIYFEPIPDPFARNRSEGVSCHESMC